MSLVSPIGVPGALTPAARANAGGAGFAVPAPAPEAASGAPSEIYPAAMAGLLALQEGGSGYRSDPAARRGGQALLGGLAALQRALLGDDTAGGALGGALARLRVLLDQMPPAEDPALAGVLAQIALRCRVELARHGG